jgi:hypothetical protein
VKSAVVAALCATATRLQLVTHGAFAAPLLSDTERTAPVHVCFTSFCKQASVRALHLKQESHCASNTASMLAGGPRPAVSAPPADIAPWKRPRGAEWCWRSSRACPLRPRWTWQAPPWPSTWLRARLRPRAACVWPPARRRAHAAHLWRLWKPPPAQAAQRTAGCSGLLCFLLLDRKLLFVCGF